MVKEVQAKGLLSAQKHPHLWFGVKYNMNIYRGCEHGCIYCDSRSECYGIENFDEVSVKVNAAELLTEELSKKRGKGIVGTGAMSDPYTYAEKKYNLTGKCLEIIAQFGFSAHIVTKSDMILRDIDILKRISKTHMSVVFTLTTADDSLASKLEPGAPPPSKRLEAMKILSSEGVKVGTAMMPILPFIEDDEENIRDIVSKTAKAGGRYIIPAMGVTLRDRQRSYYYKKLDNIYPGLSRKYDAEYGSSYGCSSRDAKELYRIFKAECSKYDIVSSMKDLPWNYQYEQLSLI